MADVSHPMSDGLLSVRLNGSHRSDTTGWRVDWLCVVPCPTQDHLVGAGSAYRHICDWTFMRVIECCVAWLDLYVEDT